MDLPGQLHKIRDHYSSCHGSRWRGVRTIISSGNQRCGHSGPRL